MSEKPFSNVRRICLIKRKSHGDTREDARLQREEVCFLETQIPFFTFNVPAFDLQSSVIGLSGNCFI